MCVCSLGHPACNAHAPYCHLRPAPLYNIFAHYLINGTIIVKKKEYLNTKCVFWISLQLSSEIFFIERRLERDTINSTWRLERYMTEIVYRSACNVPAIRVRLYIGLHVTYRLSGYSCQIVYRSACNVPAIRVKLYIGLHVTYRLFVSNCISVCM